MKPLLQSPQAFSFSITFHHAMKTGEKRYSQTCRISRKPDTNGLILRDAPYRYRIGLFPKTGYQSALVKAFNQRYIMRLVNLRKDGVTLAFNFEIF